MPQKKVSLPQLNMAGMAIEFVSNFNFLGIKIDTNLNWLSHTNLVANKILNKHTGSTLVRAVIYICLELIMNLQSNVFVSD